MNAGVRTRWYCSCCPSHCPPMKGTTCRRVQMTGPTSTIDEPRLLGELAPDRVLAALPLLDPRRRASPRTSSRSETRTGRAGCGRPGRARSRARPAGSGARSRARAHEIVQGDEPPQPLLPRERRRSRETSTAARRARSLRAGAPAGRARVARETALDRPPCRRTRSRRARDRARAIRAAPRCPRSRPRGDRPSRASCGGPRS